MRLARPHPLIETNPEGSSSDRDHDAARADRNILVAQQLVHHLNANSEGNPEPTIDEAVLNGKLRIITAQTLAEKYGHTNIDSNTTLKSVVNPDAKTAAGEVEMMDLRVCGTGPEAFFEWITECGDPIGDVVGEVGEAAIALASVPQL